MTAKATIWAIFIVYILTMIGIGWFGFRRTSTLLDYLLGGRKMSAFVSALSACASDMSGWLLMGLPGAVFAAGLGQMWIAVGLCAGSYLNWLFVARPLRRESERLNAMTISDYFEHRFSDATRSLRLITAIVILVFFLINTVSGLVAGGKLFESVFGMDYKIAVFTGAFAITVYTMMGGFIAVCLTDVVQGLLMLMALLVVPWMAVSAVGGVTAGVATIRNSAPELLGLFGPPGSRMSLIALAGTLGWGLGYFGMPHILVRFMAIRSEHDIPKARRIALSWTALSLAAAPWS
jgi:sodium/proline symporter